MPEHVSVWLRPLTSRTEPFPSALSLSPGGVSLSISSVFVLLVGRKQRSLEGGGEVGYVVVTICVGVVLVVPQYHNSQAPKPPSPLSPQLPHVQVVTVWRLACSHSQEGV